MESLYFIALLPPAKIQEEITQLKMLIAEKYSSRHALNAPPHITLHMPFKWKDKRLDELESLMKNLNRSLEPFEVQLKGFDFFEPRVVFVDVVENERLNLLQKKVVDACRKQLKLDNGNYKNHPFRPHVTIGFRDLKKPKFYEARKEFEKLDFSCAFPVGQIHLLKHDGQEWHIQEIS